MKSTEPVRPAATVPDQAGKIILERLDELASFSSDPCGLTRLYLTPEHKAAALLVMEWMRQAGMVAEIDAAGTVVGRYSAATSEAKTLILGSHIDTVRDAGRYDGTLGVAAAIQAVAELAARGERMPFAIEVVAFGDEEGVRFPVTLTGSRALAGTLSPATLEAKDERGGTLRQALLDFGCDPDRIPALGRKRADVLGYVELHIEQGPVLEAEDLPLGVVTAINGASRLKVVVSGQAGHAGTVPMALRRDALAAAAEMTLVAEQLASETASLVATVGQVEVHPGAVNVIPGQAIFTLDVRSPEDAVRKDAVATLTRRFASIAARRGVAAEVTPTYDEAAAACSGSLVDALARAVAAAGVRPRFLASGAGHDGLALAALCPIGMLFVRCAKGISHNPAESVTAADVAIGVEVLVRFLRAFRPDRD